MMRLGRNRMLEITLIVVIIILCGLNCAQFYIHQKTERRLVECIMAKNYGDLVQGDVLLRRPVQKQKFEASIPEGPSDLEMLNQIL
jgi:hypothetical protein